MAFKTGDTGEQAFAQWQAAAQGLVNPSHSPPGADALLFALRALLHPCLRPFLSDPTLTISNHFPSLDQVAGALLEMPAGYAAAAYGLGSDDHAALREAGLWEADVSSEGSFSDDAETVPEAVGAIWGSLYLPAYQKAVACRVIAAWGTQSANAHHTWPDPKPLRPASDDMEETGRVALAAALAVLRNGRGLPPDLQPGLLLWDVTAPGLPDAVLQNAQGNSLQLPLALVFLSLITNVPLPAHLAATGALGSSEAGEVLVRPVGFVPEKVQSLLLESPERVFLVPQSEEAQAAKDFDAATVPVRLLAEAAEAVTERFAATVRSALPAPSAHPTLPSPEKNADTAATTTLCISFEEANGAAMSLSQTQREHLRLAHQTLASFSPVIPEDSYAEFGDQTLFATFSSPSTALTAALALRRALRCFLPWPLPRETPSRDALLPRMGIVIAGKAASAGENEVNEQVNVLACAAYPGQILVDAGTEQASVASVHRAQSPALVPLGQFRLLNLGPPRLLHSLGDGSFSPEETTPQNTLDVRRHNLPVETLPLVGRKNEIAQLNRLLTGTTPARLITLIGEGGVGKTRLALEVAARAGAVFTGGIWFVSAAGVQNENDLAARIADTLEIRLSPDGNNPGEWVSQLAAQMANRLNEAVLPILLVLDNAENAPDTVSTFAARLSTRTGGNVSCMVTSRKPLSVPGETVFRVGPLDVPPLLLADTTAELIKKAVINSPAGVFFLSLPSVRLPQNGNWASVLILCRMLCGIPLALLLVAAQTPFLSYEEMTLRLTEFLPENEGMENNRAVLGPRILRQTLRFLAESLAPEENALLRRMAVLAENNSSDGGTVGSAGWTREAAIAVSGLDEDDARDALDALEARRLMVRHSRQNRVFYTCLPLIADWAGELLRKKPDEKEAALRAHAEYFTAFAREKSRLWDTPDEADAFDALYGERNQLHAVAAFLQQADPLAFASFVADVGHFLHYRGITEPWLHWPRRAIRIIEMENAANAAKTVTTENALLHARLYAFCALGCLDEGDTESAGVYVEAGLGVARAAHHRLDMADLLNVRGLVNQKKNRYFEALADWEAARAWFEEGGNKRGVVTVLNNVGRFYDRQKEWDAARKCHEEAAQICRRTQDKRGLCYALTNLGVNAFFRSDADGAQAYFGEQLNIARELKDAQTIAAALVNLGDVLDQLCGNTSPAVPLLVLGEQIFAKLLHPYEKEAAQYLARIAPSYGQENINFLRRDFGRRSLADLMAYPLLPPRRLVLPKRGGGKTGFFLRDAPNGV